MKKYRCIDPSGYNLTRGKFYEIEVIDGMFGGGAYAYAVVTDDTGQEVRCSVSRFEGLLEEAEAEYTERLLKEWDKKVRHRW